MRIGAVPVRIGAVPVLGAVPWLIEDYMLRFFSQQAVVGQLTVVEHPEGQLTDLKHLLRHLTELKLVVGQQTVLKQRAMAAALQPHDLERMYFHLGWGLR